MWFTMLYLISFQNSLALLAQHGPPATYTDLSKQQKVKRGGSFMCHKVRSVRSSIKLVVNQFFIGLMEFLKVLDMFHLLLEFRATATVIVLWHAMRTQLIRKYFFTSY